MMNRLPEILSIAAFLMALPTFGEIPSPSGELDATLAFEADRQASTYVQNVLNRSPFHDGTGTVQRIPPRLSMIAGSVSKVNTGKEMQRPGSLQNALVAYARNGSQERNDVLVFILKTIPDSTAHAQLEMVRTFLDLWVGDPAMGRGIESAEDNRKMDDIRDMPSILWWLSRNESIAPEARKEAWIYLGQATRLEWDGALRYKALIPVAGASIRQAEETARRDRSTKEIATTPTNSVPSRVTIQVRIRRNAGKEGSVGP